jgi:hypothetical protein
VCRSVIQPAIGVKLLDPHCEVRAELASSTIPPTISNSWTTSISASPIASQEHDELECFPHVKTASGQQPVSKDEASRITDESLYQFYRFGFDGP